MLSLVGLWLFSAPSQAAILSEGLEPPLVNLVVEMPKNGERIHLPAKDAYGRPIVATDDTLVVAMPSCDSCSIKRLDIAKLDGMASKLTVLVFPDDIPESLPNLKTSEYRILVVHGRSILPDSMHVFAPTCVWLGKDQRVKKAQASLEADGLLFKGSGPQ